MTSRRSMGINSEFLQLKPSGWIRTSGYSSKQLRTRLRMQVWRSPRWQEPTQAFSLHFIRPDILIAALLLTAPTPSLLRARLHPWWPIEFHLYPTYAALARLSTRRVRVD